MGRVLRLTLLVPDIVEAILVGRQPAGLQLDVLLRRFPVGWREQRELILNRTFGSTRPYKGANETTLASLQNEIDMTINGMSNRRPPQA